MEECASLSPLYTVAKGTELSPHTVTSAPTWTSPILDGVLFTSLFFFFLSHILKKYVFYDLLEQKQTFV